MTSDVLMDAKGGLLKVACIQMQPSFGDVGLNVKHSLQLIDKAVEKGANLVVLPELCNTGYVFDTREEALRSRKRSRRDRRSRLDRVAARHRLHLVAGICERAGASLYNSAVVIGPDGSIGTFRKVHLWDEENLFFEPGDLASRCFTTPIGRIGVAICYDGWFPETFRLCALQGADIVCVPTNWVPIPGQAEGRQAMANILRMAAAHSNSIFIACADRVASSEASPSRVRASSSAIPAGPSPGRPAGTREEIILAEVDLGEARRKRNWNAFNQVLRDRRTDVYDEMLGSGAKPGWY